MGVNFTFNHGIEMTPNKKFTVGLSSTKKNPLVQMCCHFLCTVTDLPNGCGMAVGAILYGSQLRVVLTRCGTGYDPLKKYTWSRTGTVRDFFNGSENLLLCHLLLCGPEPAVQVRSPSWVFTARVKTQMLKICF